jgi:protein transport protein SEC24
LTASSEHIEQGGIYLLDNGLEIFIWVGKQADRELCISLFNTPYENLISGKVFF